MNRKITATVRAAGMLALTGGTVIGFALPAAAAPNHAEGAQATGLITAAPLAEATYPGTSPVTVASANVGGLLTTGVITDTAGPTSASSTVSNPAATVSGTGGARATMVTSSCTFNTNTGKVSGTSRIAGGSVTAGGVPTQSLAAHAPRNTVITVPGVETITLNKHSTAADGTLTVTAIYLTSLITAQTVSIGVSVCNAASAAPVPVLPGKALDASLGGLGLLVLGLVGYQIRRRRNVTAA